MQLNIKGFFITTLLILPFLVKAQIKNEQQNKGILGVSEPALIQKMMVTMEGFENAKENMMEQSVKPFMMPIRNVKKSDPAAYAIASALEFYVNFESNYKVNLSPDYLSINQQKNGLPTNTSQLLQVVAQQGTVNADDLPYGSLKINTSTQESDKYDIDNFIYLFKEASPSRLKIFESRKALMRGNPVIVDVNITNGFKNLKTNTTELFKIKEHDTTAAGKHTLLIVSFSEHKKAFEVYNCWGNFWANAGYLWIDYEDLAAMATAGYVLVPKEEY